MLPTPARPGHRSHWTQPTPGPAFAPISLSFSKTLSLHSLPRMTLPSPCVTQSSTLWFPSMTFSSNDSRRSRRGYR